MDALSHCELGDCRDIMRRWIAAGVRVQTCVTSPPYYGLRDYGVAGQIGLERVFDCLGWAHGAACGECYVCGLREVFALVRDLLTEEGTVWLNLGDSCATVRGDRAPDGKNPAAGVPTFQPNRMPQAGLKAKDLMMIPARVALALQADGWYLRQDIIWHKPNPMPESVRDRCTKAHEYVFLLSKRERYYFDFEAFQEPVSGNAHARAPGNKTHKYTSEYWAGEDPRHRTKAGLVAYAERVRGRLYKNPTGWDTSTGEGGHGSFHKQGREAVRDAGVGPKSRPSKGAPNAPRVKSTDSFHAAVVDPVDKRNRRSVWTIPSEAYSEAHFATFPQALVEPCIVAGTAPGDTVLDPFMGSGTVAEVAQRLGRNWLGCELNQAYLALQAERTRQAALPLHCAVDTANEIA